MAQASQLYRFRIDLSDVDRAVYENLDFRVAMHPSETTDYLLSRVFAFALSYEKGLEFSPGGLSDTEEPCLKKPDPRGGLSLCIEVGSPSARRLHKDMKAAQVVKVFTYKDPRNLLREIESGEIHRSSEIEIYSFAGDFLNRVSTHLQRDNRWSLMHAEGTLALIIGDKTESGEIMRIHLESDR